MVLWLLMSLDIVLEKNIEAHLVKSVRRIGGVVWFVELKAEGGRLSPLQQVFQSEMARLGQNYVCLWSKEEIDQWISTLQN